MAKKDFGKRLIPEYLLKYSEDLHKNHPDPSASWGGSGGSTYTAGDGINISSENVISVDDTIAKKSDIPSRVKSPFLGVRQMTDGTVLFSETGQDDDYYSVYHVTEPVKVNLRALNPNFGSGLTSSYNTSTRALDVAVDTSVVALKSDIPSVPTVNDSTITFTQGGVTKGSFSLNQATNQTIELDAGGGGSTTNMVTTDTNQDITGEKTFVGTKRIKFKQSSQEDRLGFTGFDADGTEIGYLEMSKRDRDFTGSPISNMLGYWSNVNSAPNPSSDVMLGFKYYTKDSDGNRRDYRLVVPPRYNEVNATRYIPISVNGTIADNTGNITVNASSTSTLTPTTETLVFTLSDNSTVTVNVMTGGTVSTTTTLS